MAEFMGDYELIKLLAKGGMAEIFTARKKGVEQLVCIKRIRPEFSGDPEFSAMFRQEARIAMALDHPNIVKVFGFDEYKGQLYLVMEYVEGMDLKQVITGLAAQGLTVPIGFAFDLFQQLLQALDAASSAVVAGQEGPVVHRDISPHNLLVGRNGIVKLTDFGIAKAKGASTVTRTGVIKGKLAYLAPEQATGGQVGPSADLFSAALVLWELLRGRRVNDGKNDGELLAWVLNPKFEPMPWLSDSINALLGQLIVKKTDQRFASASAVLGALKRISVPAWSSVQTARMMAGIDAVSVSFSSTRILVPGKPASKDKSTASHVETGFRTRNSRQRRAWSLWPTGRFKMPRWVIIWLLGPAAVVVGVFLAALLFRPVSVEGTESAVAAAVVSAPKSAPVAFGGGSVKPPVKVPENKLAVESVVVRADSVPKPIHIQPPDDEGATVDDEPEIPAHMKGEPNKAAEPHKSSVVRGTTHLKVSCRPWAVVLVDGKKMGTTPLTNLLVSAGKHKVTLVNTGLKYRKTIRVNGKSGETVRINEQIPR